MRPGPWSEYEEERRESQGSGERIFAIVVIAGLAFLAGRQVFFGDPTKEGPTAAESVPAAPALEQVQEVPSRTAQAAVAPASIETPTNARTLNVYECVVNGQRVLSDQRCSKDARERTVVVTRPDPSDVALAQRRAAEQRLREAYQTPPATDRPRFSRSGAAASYAPDNSSRCANVDQRIEWLNARMRQGYDSKEGEWLRKEWHALKQERWDLKCGG